MPCLTGAARLRLTRVELFDSGLRQWKTHFIVGCRSDSLRHAGDGEVEAPPRSTYVLQPDILNCPFSSNAATWSLQLMPTAPAGEYLPSELLEDHGDAAQDSTQCDNRPFRVFRDPT